MESKVKNIILSSAVLWLLICNGCGMVDSTHNPFAGKYDRYFPIDVYRQTDIEDVCPAFKKGYIEAFSKKPNSKSPIIAPEKRWTEEGFKLIQEEVLFRYVREDKKEILKRELAEKGSKFVYLLDYSRHFGFRQFDQGANQFIGIPKDTTFKNYPEGQFLGEKEFKEYYSIIGENIFRDRKFKIEILRDYFYVMLLEWDDEISDDREQFCQSWLFINSLNCSDEYIDLLLYSVYRERLN